MYKNIIYITFLFFVVSCSGGGGSSSSPELPSIFNPVINSFSSSSTSILSGDSVDLSWTTTNAIGCSGSGDWEGSNQYLQVLNH